MQKELEQRLVERWPTWFKVGGDIRNTAMPRGFEHDDGWFDSVGGYARTWSHCSPDWKLQAGISLKFCK